MDVKKVGISQELGIEMGPQVGEEVPGKRGEKGYNKEEGNIRKSLTFSHSSLYSLPLAAWFQRCTHLSTQPSGLSLGASIHGKVTSWFPIPHHKEIPKTFHTLLSSSSPLTKPSTSPANEIYSYLCSFQKAP